jgi:hypothetical protein
MSDQDVARELRRMRSTIETAAEGFGRAMIMTARTQEQAAAELKRIADMIEKEIGEDPVFDGEHPDDDGPRDD